MDIKILKPGDKVFVECTVQAVFANSKMVMVTTRDCTEGFDAYIDEITTKNNLGVDAISRAYLYNRIKGIDHDEDYECDEFGGSRITYHTCDWDEVLREIEDAPSVTPQEPRWILVSERLPEDSGEYFVTVIDEDVETYKHTGIAWYAHPKDYDVEEGDWRELMIDEKVIAWMPLPQPYKAEKEEEHADSN